MVVVLVLVVEERLRFGLFFQSCDSDRLLQNCDSDHFLQEGDSVFALDGLLGGATKVNFSEISFSGNSRQYKREIMKMKSRWKLQACYLEQSS